MRLNIVWLLLLFLVISCKQDHKNKDDQIVETHESTEEMVMLDGGKLWKTNIETSTGINTMIHRMNSFSKKENLEAFHILKDSLESDFTEIFQKCTMKGEAHNQLHNYLKPMVDLFEGLGSQQIDSCKISFLKLDKHLESYKNYFE